jgi:XisI protein
MDKVTQYKKIAADLIQEIGSIANPYFKGIETEIITDNIKGHFLLFSVGWHERHWHYGSYVHIDVKPDGKVWLQHDGTDLNVVQELEQRGIPKHDIVLGYKAPHEREAIGQYALT